MATVFLHVGMEKNFEPVKEKLAMKTETTTDKKTLSRRTLLARLGLATGVAYAAPVMLKLSEARASSFSSFSNFSGSGSGSGSGVRKRRRVHTQGHYTHGRVKTRVGRHRRRRHVRRSFSSS
jgi:hypothetical protein